MIIEGKDVKDSIQENPDVCIIGTGAAGAILAWELSEKAMSIVLLEKGGYYPKETHNQTEDVMIPRLYKYNGTQFAVPYGIAVAQGNCVGGSTVINDAVCFDTPEYILQEWEEKYKIENISLNHMQKYFDKIRKRISVNRVQEHELNTNNKMLRKGCQILGWQSEPNERNCKTCRQCGMCHIGCYYGTKQSMLETYIADVESLRSNIVKIYTNCSAERIILSNNKVKGVIGSIKGTNGHLSKVHIKPKILIVSAGAIASSEILLKSKINRNRLVGRNIALHPSPSVVGDFDEEINGHEGIPLAYHCSEFSRSKIGERGYIIESVFLSPYQFALPLPAFGYQNKELMSRYNHYAMAGILLEDEPVGYIRVDKYLGTIINYDLSTKDKKKMIEGMKNTAKIFFSAGAKRVITSHRKLTILYSDDPDELDLINQRGVSPLDIYLGSAHPQGGNRMGGDQEKSVVDSYGKFHGIENLFVSDASIFPTAVGVNPQLSVMAIASRTAEYIIQHWNKVVDK